MDAANLLDILLAIVLVVLAVAVLPAVAGVFAVFYIGRRIYYAVSGKEYVPLFSGSKQPKYDHQDVEAGSTVETVRKVLNDYAKYDTVGKFAREGRAQLDGVARKSEAFFAILDNKFQSGSLSWDKFAVGADTVQQAVLNNCASLANRIQTFDRADYRKLNRLRRDNQLKNSAPLNATQEEKLAMLEASLAEMDGIIATNDQLLLEFDKLMAELDKLQNADFNEEGERLLQEIRTLIEETRYYQQA